MTTITSKIKLIGGILSLIIVAIAGITVYINHTSKRDSAVINIAGKERMLTQQITKEVLWLQNRDDEGFGAMDSAREEFALSLNDLISGNPERGIYAPPKRCIAERLEQVSALWERFDSHVQTFKRLLQTTAELKAVLPTQSEAILSVSDKVVKQMVAEGYEGALIDDAGRQRMLTQRIGLSAMQYLITGEAGYFTRFQHAYSLYEATLRRFVNDAGLRAHPELHRLLAENETVWREYSTFIVTLMERQKEINNTVWQIKELNVVLLDTMDSAVAAYSAYSEAQRNFLQYFQYGMSLVALLFMLYAARLTRRIREDFDRFLDRSKAMAASVPVGEQTVRFLPTAESLHADELSQASLHMSQFVDKINTVLKHAEQAIHESEQAARELATFTDGMDRELDGMALDEDSKRDIDRTIDRSEDIVIQSLEELSGTSKLLTQLQAHLAEIVSKAGHGPRLS